MFSNAVPIGFYAYNGLAALQYSGKGKFSVSFWEWDRTQIGMIIMIKYDFLSNIHA